MECDYIEDYERDDLDEHLKRFFENNKIENFEIEEIKLHINGRSLKHKNARH